MSSKLRYLSGYVEGGDRGSVIRLQETELWLDLPDQSSVLDARDAARAGCPLCVVVGVETPEDMLDPSELARDEDGEIGEGQLLLSTDDFRNSIDRFECALIAGGRKVKIHCAAFDLEAICAHVERKFLKIRESTLNGMTGAREFIVEMATKIAVALGLVDEQLLLPFVAR